MSDPTATAERREQMLGLLAEKALALACAVQQRALQAETSEEMAQLSQAFVRLGRSVRQSIALHARLEKDRAGVDHAAAQVRVQDHALAVGKRKRDLRKGVEDVLCADWDPEIDEDNGESFELAESLRERLDDLSEVEGFLDLDPDQLIEQLCEDLSVEAAKADAVLAPHKAAALTAPPKPSLPKPSPPKPDPLPLVPGPTPGARPDSHIAELPPADTS